jgi:diamine N-acetyltransferase
MPFAIRAAKPEDAAIIAGLIRELANYEQLAHEAAPDVHVLTEQLKRHACPRVEALLAIDTETHDAVGFALFFQHYSTFLTRWGLFLEDLYVRPAYRKKGVGFALFRTLSQIAHERGHERLEWSVLNWNDLAIKFYKKLGATALREWTTMRLEGDALRALAQDSSGTAVLETGATSGQPDPVG